MQLLDLPIAALADPAGPAPGFTMAEPAPAAPTSADDGVAIRITDMGQGAWRATGKPGLWLMPVREDREQGLYLGLVRFDAFVGSGLHQHQGVATSFVVSGGLTDYHGSIGVHEAGINVKGSTHDAIAYQPTVLVSRLEGPVTYPPKVDLSGLHSGSRHASIQNPDPDAPPEINVTVDTLPYESTGVFGVRRQMVFDYRGSGGARRMVQLTLRPGVRLAFRTSALTEFWVRGGQADFGGRPAGANCFVACDADTPVEIESPYGAILLAWAEGRETGSAGNLFGF